MEMDLNAANNALVEMNLQKAIKDAAATRQSIVPAALLRKGDVPGHEFHGNQYAGGGGGTKEENEKKNLHAPGDHVSYQYKGKLVETVVRSAHTDPVTGSRLYHMENGQNIWSDNLDSKGRWTADPPRLPKLNAAGSLSKIHNKTTGRWRVIDYDGHQHGEHGSEAEADAQLAALGKGDVAGHEFHGNQYSAGSLSDKANALSEKATTVRTHSVAAVAHYDAADAHAALGNKDKAKEHTAKAKAHAQVMLTGAALRGTKKIHNHMTGEWRVEDSDGCTVVAADSEEALDALLRKGDVPGHEFHGNQYTDGGAAAKEANALSNKAGAIDLHNIGTVRIHERASEAHIKAAAKAKNSGTAKTHKELARYHSRTAAQGYAFGVRNAGKPGVDRRFYA